MNKRISLLLHIIACILGWVVLDEWHGRILAERPALSAAKLELNHLKLIKNGPNWSERLASAKAARAQWDGVRFKGSSISAIKAEMMDHYTELATKAKVGSYNISMTDRQFAASYATLGRGAVAGAIDQTRSSVGTESMSEQSINGLIEVVVTFSGNFNAITVTDLVRLLANSGKLYRLESIVIKSARFELVIRTLAHVQSTTRSTLQ